ncbi:MAG: hypothetical protein QXZ28_02530 [Candidatus Methanomethylicaceae archaeon]
MWIRGEEVIDLKQPQVFLALGRRGAGKSALLEALAEHYFAGGNNILDLFGASSGEGLAWLRSPWAREDDRALLLKGNEVDVRSSWDAKSWRNITLNDLENNRLVISATPLYKDKEEEFVAAGKVLDLLFQRISYSKLIYLLVRESASLFYSRLKIRKSQLEAKAEGSYLIREARHHGLCLALDTQKITAVDLDLRAQCDYIFIKSQGILSLPREWWWLYGYFDPKWISNMPKRDFAIVSAKGHLGVGENELPSWHKGAKESILRALGISVEKGECEREEIEDKLSIIEPLSGSEL